MKAEGLVVYGRAREIWLIISLSDDRNKNIPKIHRQFDENSF